ncbi:hypothetical protein TNCV_1747401 [Trichonephila clavipes]|nr:hypothetical protein TNCV_1747401 [Trichonephila clavipes]
MKHVTGITLALEIMYRVPGFDPQIQRGSSMETSNQHRTWRQKPHLDGVICKNSYEGWDVDDSSESVQEFAARINKLGTQIFQSGNSAQNTAVRNANDQLLQSRFISGLRNDIRRFVLSRDPLNLDESINAALIEEQNMKLNQIANDERSGLSPAQTENSVLSALTDRLEEINLRVGRLQEASSVTARKTGGIFLTEGRMFSNVFIVAFKDIDKRSVERSRGTFVQPITSPPEKRR